MSLLRGSTGFLRYSIEGDLPGNLVDFVTERLGNNAFVDIDDSYQERSIGWTSLFDTLGPRFDDGNHVVGDNLVFTLRIDERKVAPAALKKFCQKEEERVKKMKQVPRLSRAQRLEIKENIRLQLMKKAVPVPTVVDVWWSLADNTVYLLGTSTKLQEIFETMFRDSFNLGVVLQVPYLAAQRLIPKERHAALDELTPCIFAA